MSQLVLYPQDYRWIDHEQQLNSKLQEIAFIGAKIGENHFYTGDRFLNLLSFMGCSPHIQIDFDPKNPQKAFCSIKHQSSIEPLLLHSRNMRPPKCPHCKKAVKNWQDYRNNSIFSCPNCQQSIQISSLNWKEQAGFAATMLIIDNIYPQEAQPTPELLSSLQAISLCNWQHFFLF